jgi:multidrug efflux pump subunit AcrB
LDQEELQILLEMEKNILLFLQGDIKDRQEPDSISKVFVRSKNNNKLVSISNLVAYDEEGQSPFLSKI